MNAYIVLMDLSNSTYFANIIHLGRMFMTLVSDQPNKVCKFLRNGFARYIFILNKMGKFVDFKITDFDAFKKIVEEDVKYINRTIVVDSQRLRNMRVANAPKLCVFYNDNTLRCGKYYVPVTAKQYAFLAKNYTGANLNVDAFLLGFFYKTLGCKNIHISIPPRLIKILGASVELFGTPFNVSGPYCSPLEFEKRFGSLGSFYDYIFMPGQVYAANPPYDEEIMSNMADKIIEAITNLHNIVFLVTIPVWDPQTQQQMGIIEKKKFDAYDKLIPHVKYHKIFNKNDIKYYNYYSDEDINVVATHIMIVASNDYDMTNITNILDQEFLS